MAKLAGFAKSESLEAPVYSSPYIAPPTKIEGNLYTITGMVEGVVLSGFEMQDGPYGRSAMFTFSNEAGQTTRKYVGEPTDPDSAAANAIMEMLCNLHTYFFENTEAKLVDETGEAKDFQTVEELCETLFGDESLPSSKKGKLKMVFKTSSGQYPNYQVAKYNWFGDGIYFSKKEKDEKNGQLRFTKTVTPESEATFSSGGLDEAPKKLDDGMLF